MFCVVAAGMGRGRYVYSQRDFGRVGVLDHYDRAMSGFSGLCGNMLGNFGISQVMGSGIVISGDALMGYDGVYRAWCGKPPLVWIGPTI